jgi:hypothetical protein
MMKAKIIMINQSFLNRKLYLDNANPVKAETIVWPQASNAENQIEFTKVFFKSSTVPATVTLWKEGLFGSHSTEGSMTSLPDINAMEIMRNIGSK